MIMIDSCRSVHWWIGCIAYIYICTVKAILTILLWRICSCTIHEFCKCVDASHCKVVVKMIFFIKFKTLIHLNHSYQEINFPLKKSVWSSQTSDYVLVSWALQDLLLDWPQLTMHLFQDLYKKTRSILNKLTPQKFQVLLSQMQALKIDTESKLKGVIDLVFEKAISEPNFSVAYANMCRCLSMVSCNGYVYLCG